MLGFKSKNAKFMSLLILSQIKNFCWQILMSYNSPLVVQFVPVRLSLQFEYQNVHFPAQTIQTCYKSGRETPQAVEISYQSCRSILHERLDNELSRNAFQFVLLLDLSCLLHTQILYVEESLQKNEVGEKRPVLC